MAWYSILPADLIYVESWAVRIFFFLGIITIVPWLALLIFDVGLYIFRMLTNEFPYIGGRVRGMQRPRAPSLNERSGGQRIVFSLGAGYESTDIDEKRGEEPSEEGKLTRRNPREVSDD